MVAQPKNEHALELALNSFAGSNIRAVEYRDNLFEALGFPRPNAIPLMPLPFQIAQKLHGVTSPGNDRARDLIDLQLIMSLFVIDMEATADVCRRLFKYRRRQPWPPQISKGTSWDALYTEQRGSLPVLPTADEAVAWANALIARLDNV